jgi:hypothetical protein
LTWAPPKKVALELAQRLLVYEVRGVGLEVLDAAGVVSLAASDVFAIEKEPDARVGEQLRGGYSIAACGGRYA